MRRLFLKLRRRRRLHAELDEELAFHREQSRLHGNPVGLGHEARIREEALDLWRFTTIENLWRDIVYGARGLRRAPALVVSAMLSLGLGIGVNATMFSLGVELLWSRPSVSDASSIVRVRLGGNSHANPHVFEAVRDSGVFASLVGQNEELLNWDDGDQTRPVFGLAVTRNAFTALGIPVALGRGILPGDPDEVVVLRHGFWQSRFGGDPSVLGRSMRLEGRPFTIVGILPRDHRTLIGFGFSPDLYVPVSLPDSNLMMYGRLPSGSSLSAVRDQLHAVATRIDATAPEVGPDFKYASAIDLDPVAGWPRLKGALSSVALFFAVLLAVVGLVLLIACVNVAGLLLARASARRRELAIRLALGASRRRLLQQLLVESLLLALSGAAVGLALAQLVASAISRLQLPLPVPIRLYVEVDWRVALYAALMTGLAAAFVGVLPAAQAVREAIASELPRRNRLRLRRVLIAAQVAVSIVVLAAAGLFLRNLLAANAMSPGFDVHRTLRAEVNLPAATYADADRIRAYVDQVLPVLEALPGIERAAAARTIPFRDQATRGATLTFPDTGDTVHAGFHWNAVTPGFFEALDIPLLEGRDFTATDTSAESVAIVNRVFVERYLGGRAAVNTVFLWGRDGMQPYRIVGVVGNTKTITVGEDERPQLYEPLAQIASDNRRLHIVLRSATPPALQVEAVRRAVRRVDSSVGIEAATMYSSVGLAVLPSQIGAALMGSAGVLALVLAAVGLYGMTAYSVARRVSEFGVRMALGASQRELLTLVVAEALRVIAAGSVVGIAIALVVMRPLSLFLVEPITPADPPTLALVLVVLTVTGVLTSLGPARRAARVDAATALRAE